MRDYGRGGEPVATWTDETTVFTSDDDWECGVSEDHDVPEGRTICRVCDADCSEWDDDNGDDDPIHWGS